MVENNYLEAQATVILCSWRCISEPRIDPCWLQETIWSQAHQRESISSFNGRNSRVQVWAGTSILLGRPPPALHEGSHQGVENRVRPSATAVVSSILELLAKSEWRRGAINLERKYHGSTAQSTWKGNIRASTCEGTHLFPGAAPPGLLSSSGTAGGIRPWQWRLEKNWREGWGRLGEAHTLQRNNPVPPLVVQAAAPCHVALPCEKHQI